MSLSRPKNPFGFRLLWAQTLLLAVAGWGRAWVVITGWSRYNALVDHLPGPLYVAASVGWGLVFSALTWGIWRRQQWAIRWLWPILAAYAVFALVWRWVFVQAPAARANFPFLLGLTIALLFVNLWLIKRQPMQAAFHQPRP